ncbi:MAG: FAD-dependent thymidylate synthase [Chloroflexi bacterium]|nr:FAD-dependent thymidylate synthase [Chloroflexota bacterium]
MNDNRRVYLLDSRELSPETIAVTFAKTSRSPQSFDQIAHELSDEKSSQFHEKWVVGYGHASVAEHAVLHIAVENISRLAVECLESNRLASYTEKSSRYQVWSADHFFIPDEIKKSNLLDLYQKAVRTLFNKYHDALPVIRTHLEKEAQSRNKDYTEREIHACCMDVCRYYLPAAATANVGMTINARSLEHALRKMLSHPLEEVRQIGSEIKQVALTHLPALIKYVEAVPYLKQACQQTPKLLHSLPSNENQMHNWCELVDLDEKFEEHILTALSYRFGETAYGNLSQAMKAISDDKKRELHDILFGNLNAHDIPLRELEYSWFVFDILMDQGAYFEFKRHRMMTQTPQALTPHEGYAVPRLLVDAGLEADFKEGMRLARDTYEQIVHYNQAVASYVIPNAYNRRVLAGLNLRTAMHFTQLRIAPNAHFAIRRVANRMLELIQNRMQLFRPYFQAQTTESWQSIEREYFSSVQSE